MKGIAYKIFLVLAAATLVCGCGLDEPAPAPIPSDDVIKVTGRMTPFAEINPDTKSTKNQYETAVKNMAMFVFDSVGNKVDYQITNNSQPLFLIDRNDEPYNDHDQSKMDKCKIYILANIPTADQTTLTGITTEDGFLATDCTISNVIRTSEIDSYGGLPMWGVISETSTGGKIDLSADEDPLNPTNPLIGQVLTIPLTCMMSKLTFNVTVDPIQKSDYIQRFELKSWTVENAPADVQVAQPTGTDESAHADDGPFLGAVTFGQVDNGVNPIMQGGSTAMSFCCYVPEHRVSPDSTVTYPSGVVEGDQVSQNFKPDWLKKGQRPIKVTLKGVYTDHRNQEKEVTYTLYPGANNYNDFFVERNHEYIHNISIKGISNSKYGDEGTISVDLRVDVKQNDFKFELERETLLDSHWEIRPIRITLDPVAHPKADHIEVEILSASSTPWIRFEAPTASQISTNASLYCDVTSDALAYGKRRYFTTDLVTNTLSGNTYISFNADPNNVEHTIWAYIDENVSEEAPLGSTNRQATVQCRYYEKNNTDPTVTENYYFIQKSLHGISYNSHNYGIEYYEEYLYNFDSRDDFTALPDGMEWGMDGVQLSHEINAIAVDGVLSDDAATNKVRSVFPNAYYDFYNTSEEAAGGRLEYFPYAGRRFTQKIKDKVGFAPLATNTEPASAVEYCLNKNKRNSDGTIPDGFYWYLPAIDEIESICMGAYSDFEVFQDKYYWSSQPAYNVDSLSYTLIWSTNYGNFYEDNVNYARATKVNYTGGSYRTAKSGAVGSEIMYSFYYFSNGYDPSSTGKTTHHQDGYQPRTGKENRIRCAYKILQNYTSTFGFETASSEGIWVSSGFDRAGSNYNTDPIHNGSRGGSSSTGSGSATITTNKAIAAPGQLSFYIKSARNDRLSTWKVQVSSNGTSGWTDVSSTTDTNSWQQVSVDLSAHRNVYIRISSTRNSGSSTTRYIDDISLSYKD